MNAKEKNVKSNISALVTVSLAVPIESLIEHGEKTTEVCGLPVVSCDDMTQEEIVQKAMEIVENDSVNNALKCLLRGADMALKDNPFLNCTYSHSLGLIPETRYK